MSNPNRRGPIAWMIDAFRADPFRFFCGVLVAIVAVSLMTLAIVVCLLIRCANQT